MDSLTLHKYLRNFFFCVAIIAAAVWAYTVRYLPAAEGEPINLQAFVSIMVAFSGLFLGMVTSVTLGDGNCEKAFNEEGWYLAEIRVHISGRPDAIIPVGKEATDSSNIRTSLLRQWGNELNANPSATRIGVRNAFARPFPTTYIFEKGSPEQEGLVPQPA